MPGYGQMPGGSYTPPAPPVRPKTLDLAVKLMQAGGVLALLNVLSVFLFRDSIREAAEKSAQTTPNVDLDTVVAISMGFAIVFGLLGAGLWFWMAALNGKGRSWARIVATVLFGISLLSMVFSLTQPQPILARLLSVLSLLVGAGATYLMWQKESSAFYASASVRH